MASLCEFHHIQIRLLLSKVRLWHYFIVFLEPSFFCCKIPNTIDSWAWIILQEGKSSHFLHKKDLGFLFKRRCVCCIKEERKINRPKIRRLTFFTLFLFSYPLFSTSIIAVRVFVGWIKQTYSICGLRYAGSNESGRTRRTITFGVKKEPQNHMWHRIAHSRR